MTLDDGNVMVAGLKDMAYGDAESVIRFIERSIR